MRKSNNIVFFIILTGIAISCGNKHHTEKTLELQSFEISEINDSEIRKEESSSVDFTLSDIIESDVGKEMKQKMPNNFISSYAASVINDNESHKLIRNVNMKFKVNDVPESTYIIENLTLKNGGHIRRSDINNRNSYSSTVNISKDSAIIIHHNNIISNIQLRVHYTRLDTLLKEIAPLAIHIDYRTIDVRDVTLELLAKKLKKERMDKKQNRISTAIDNRGRKLNDIVDAENALDYTAEQSDKALLEDYSIKDQIEYSTINIELYQNISQYQEKVVRDELPKEYEPSFSSKIASALQYGWELLSGFIILLINIWPLLLILTIAISMGIYFKNKKHKNQ